jgi:pimeloyl-ACP methyl ester carboxylesterase
MKTTKFIVLNYAIILVFLLSISCKTEPNNYINSSDGVEIKFNIQGKGEPSLIFVHGWSNNKSIWDAQVAHFSKKYKVITVDLPGFGESGNNRENWSMAVYGEDVAAVINYLELKNVILVGFSMGAPVVIESAKRFPDKISGLVLVDYLHNVEMKYSPEVISFMDSIYMDVVNYPTMEKLTPFFKKNKEESFKRITSMLNEDVSKVGWRESLNDVFRWENEDFVASLKNINVPITAINSEQPATNVEAFQKYVPSFNAKIINDTGHVVFWDAPEVFNRYLEEIINEYVKDN